MNRVFEVGLHVADPSNSPWRIISCTKSLTSAGPGVLSLFMPAASEMAEKHARILGELAEFGLNLARKLHDQGMAAETPQETADLARAFHSVSRSVRHTLALEARLARDARRQGDADRAEAPAENRKNRIGNTVQRIIAAEYEDEDEAERLCDEVYDRLQDDAQAPDFLDQAIDDQIARLCKDFGLTPPKRTATSAPPPRDPPMLNPSPTPYSLGDGVDPAPP